MKRKESEFENFNDTMDKLLAVPYTELQKKLEDEKRQKEEKKRERSTSSFSGRVDDKRR